MQKSVLRINFSTPLLQGSLLALGLSAAACGSSTDAPTGGTRDSGSGGGSNSSGGAHNTGGSKSSGGSIGTGGAKASGGSSGNGGSKATGGSSGSGGAATGGNGGGDGGPDGCTDPETLTVPANIPAIIQTPAGVTLIHHFHANGTQNYKCTGTPVVGDAGMTTYAWPAAGPEANLSDNCGKKVGTHFAPVVASSPQWQFTMDGSIVQGAKANAGSPVAGSIPQLLLNATDHIGTGELSDVTFIQRLDTTGGVAPDASTCSASNLGEVKKIPYTADYYFYTGPGDGGP